MKEFQSETIIKHYSPTGRAMTTVMLIIMVIIQFHTAKSVESVIAKSECQETCGGVSISYPFGIGPDCSMSGFEVECNTTYNPPRLIFNTVAVHSISLSSGQVTVNNPISSNCYNATATEVDSIEYSWNLSGTPFFFNYEKNKFTVMGCDTLAYIQFGNETNLNWGGCVLECNSPGNIINGSCSGIGCCQTAIPQMTNYYKVQFATTFNNSKIYNFSRCGYALIMQDAGFIFNSDYITTNKLYDQQFMPIVLDWSIGKETCDFAQANKTSYACISDNSICVNSTNGPGYFCNCSTGYDGNPYLQGGCKDINECLDKSTCSPLKCNNTPGSYECSCPPGTHKNKNTGDCYKNEKLSLWVKLVVGISIGLMLAVIFSCSVYFIHERRKVAAIKEKYFEQYGGQLLYQEMKSKQGFAFTIFKEEELKEVTNNFDAKFVLGEGGNGTVYKGNLSNNEDVAIKRCKTIDERQKKEFGKEILILSQINHKNIVRILGCCLEVEIPILVYEFVPNGTLFDLIHSKNATRISLKTRLRIAQEAADALAYLHLWATPPIVHRDVKSSNILLGENFTAKVSDFGASVLAPAYKDQFLTLVQGTRGYLDPEYMQTGQLTVKSDVYSFGVVLLELLTRKMAFYLDGAEERCLSSAFLSAIKENKLVEILDDQILDEENMNLINGVAELAKECLNMEGEKRPEMREIAERLDRLRKTMTHPWMQDNQEEIQCLISEPSNNQLEMTSYSLEEKAMLAIGYGR